MKFWAVCERNLFEFKKDLRQIHFIAIVIKFVTKIINDAFKILFSTQLFLNTLATVGFKLKITKIKAYHIEKEFKEQWIADWCPVVYVIWKVGVPKNIPHFCPDLEVGT
jgi:hypothetical protein